MKNKTFIVPQLIEERINEVVNINLLTENELSDIIEHVEDDMVLERATEIQKKRNKFKGPSFNGVF